MNKKNYSEYIKIASFVIVLLAYGAKFVLMSDQVKRNAKEIVELKIELKQANIEVLNYRLEQIESKTTKIYDFLMEQ